MKTRLKTLLFIAAGLCTPVLAQPGNNPNNGQGLAIGQSPNLLQTIRDSDAGAGSGGEFITVKGSFSVIGYSAHARSCTSQVVLRTPLQTGVAERRGSEPRPARARVRSASRVTRV